MAPRPFEVGPCNWQMQYEMTFQEFKDNYAQPYAWFERHCTEFRSLDAADKIIVWLANTDLRAMAIGMFPQSQHQADSIYGVPGFGENADCRYGKIKVFDRSKPAMYVEKECALVDDWMIVFSASFWANKDGMDINIMERSIDNWLDFADMKKHNREYPGKGTYGI